MTADSLIQDFAALDDWEARYSLIIELGARLPEMPESLKIEAHRVQGCQSKVWLVPSISNESSENSQFDFIADSDSQIVRGLLAILRILYSAKPIEDARKVDAKGYFSNLGLLRHLSPGRSNGLTQVIKRINRFLESV